MTDARRPRSSKARILALYWTLNAIAGIAILVFALR
jgi:hypothetical protein